MIPVLFAPNTREYNNNGLGVLVDVGYCTVTEERNGAFELELQYPVKGSHYADLSVDCQILAKPNETSNPQAFRIYNVSKPMNGVVTVRAEHISYELSSIVVSPFSASNVGEALSKIKSNSVTENVFTFWTDKNTVANMSHSTPLSARSLLGGVAGSVIDTYTGEFEFDNYTVKLHQNRGADNGVVIAYAKNLTGVKCEERSDGVVTGAIAYWTGETDGIAQSVYGDLQTIETSLSYSRNVIVDCSSEFTDPPSKASLNEYATKYIQNHKNFPYFSVSVEFVNLGDTEEYKQYKGLYRVNLCDTVTVRHPLYGIDVKAKVVKTIFDSVREKYEKIEIGEISANISRTIANQEKEMSQKVSLSQLDKAIINATNAITGNKGGYVVLNPPTNPQELLILDKPNINEAVNVWRWNLGGLGHSNTGYSGSFTTAITADGQIVADFITTGTLNADNIEVINLSANSITSGILSSTNGFSYFSLETGYARFGGSQYYTEVQQGEVGQYLSSSGGRIGGLVVTGSNNNAYETLFYDYGNNFSKGVSISGISDANGILEIATFSLNNINLYSQPILYIDTSPARGYIYRRYLEMSGGGYTDACSSLGISRLNNMPSIALDQYSYGNPNDYIRFEIAQSVGEAYVALRGRHNNNYSGILELGEKMWWDGDFYSYGDVSGESITNRSDRKIKKNIQSTKTKNALSAIKSLNIYDYDLKSNGKSIKMGLIADEVPAEILSGDGKGINLYSYCGMLALAVKELSQKIEKLEKGGDNNENDNKQKT